MTFIVSSRNKLNVEEISYRSAISEGVGERIGASINHIFDYQHVTYQFNINGPYGGAAAPITQIDGLMPILFDMEITGAFVFGAVNSGSGTTTMDLHRIINGGTDTGTIFSTKPSIATSAVNGAYALRDLTTPIDYTATGITLPVFSVTELDAGDALRFDLDSVMSAGENCGVHILYRPR